MDTNGFLVFQSDFGLVDGAVSAMKGVAYMEDPGLTLADITHEITPFNVFEASYRLIQTVGYWPKGTVFVSVVDPGVGSDRKSLLVRTVSGIYIVTPDNGTLTHVKNFLGIDKAWEIDTTSNRLADSEKSYTFHGRDVYAYTGARLASGHITPDSVGPEIDPSSVIELPLFKTVVKEDSVLGQVDILDVRFGSLWTSVSYNDFSTLGVNLHDKVELSIFKSDVPVFNNHVRYGHSFADVRVGMPIVYMNSVNHMAVAINQGSFSDAYKIGVGSSWTVEFKKI